MIVRWTEKAFLSLEQISHHIADDNPESHSNRPEHL